jgi:hypothetical protein
MHIIISFDAYYYQFLLKVKMFLYVGTKSHVQTSDVTSGMPIAANLIQWKMYYGAIIVQIV